MNILLTGGAGYIGSHVAVALIDAGHNVVLFDNFCNSHPDVVQRLQTITGQTIPLVEGDVRDTALLTDTFKRFEIEGIVHFAGLKAVGESISNPIAYYANNVQGTISLLQAMQACGLKKLVFSSSATVYGEAHYLPYDESHPTSAVNPYGRSKLHVEEILHDLSHSDSTWQIACLRYFNPVGAHPSGLIGEDPQGTPNNLLPYVAQVAVGKLARLNVYGNDYDTPDGTGVRDYIHVMDLAEGHVAALQFLQSQTGWHAINLGTGRGTSVLEMVHAFEAASGKSIPYSIVARREGDLAVSFASADKARTLLGWVASRTLQDVCESAWKWQSQHAGLKQTIA